MVLKVYDEMVDDYILLARTIRDSLYSLWVCFRGRIIFGEEADELKRVILDLLNETHRIVLNLLWIEHIDSTGLGTLVRSSIFARHRGAEIKFAALSANVRRAMKTTNVNRLFEVYDTTEEAIKSFHPHPEVAA